MVSRLSLHTFFFFGGTLFFSGHTFFFFGRTFFFFGGSWSEGGSGSEGSWRVKGSVINYRVISITAFGL